MSPGSERIVFSFVLNQIRVESKTAVSANSLLDLEILKPKNHRVSEIN